MDRKFVRLGAIASLSLSLVASGMVALPATAAAKSPRVIETGSCTGNSTWKLKVKPDDGRLEVEFEVDQNRVGKTWNVKLKRNGNVFFKGQKTTKAPSGSFSVERKTGNAAGSDKIVGRAVNPRSGEICRGVVTF